MIRSFFFFFNAALSIILSFFPVYLRALGYSATEIANILVIETVIGLVGVSILWGWISDRTQRPALMLKILAFGAAFSFIPILTGQYWMIFIGFVLFGFFTQPISGIADSLAIIKTKEMGVDYGKIRVWGSIGWLSASFLIGFILTLQAVDIPINSFGDLWTVLKFMFEGKDINWNNPMVIMLIIGGFALTFISALGFKERKLEQKSEKDKVKFTDIKAIFKNSYFLVFLLVVIFHIICLRSYFFTYGMHIQNLKLSPAVLSIAFSVGTLAEIVAFTFFGKIRKYLKLETIVGIALFVSAIRWILVANTSSPFVVISLQILQAASTGLFIAAAVSIVAEAAEPRLLATYQQVYNYTMAIGNFIGIYIAGFVFDYFQSGVPVFYTMSFIEFVGMIFILVVISLKKKRPVSAKV